MTDLFTCPNVCFRSRICQNTRIKVTSLNFENIMRKCASQLRHERLWAFHENRITRFERLRMSAVFLRLYHIYFDTEKNMFTTQKLLPSCRIKHDMNLNYKLNARIFWPDGVLT